MSRLNTNTVAERRRPSSGLHDLSITSAPTCTSSLRALSPKPSFRWSAYQAPRIQVCLRRSNALARKCLTFELLPPRPRPQLISLTRSAVAVVNSAEHEGMPNIFLEGWTYGVPALAYSNDPDGVLQRFGLGYCAFGSFDSFVEHAQSLWDERHDREPVSARCRNYVATTHSPAVVAHQWADALELTSDIDALTSEDRPPRPTGISP